MAITWKYVKPLKHPNAIEAMCNNRGIHIPAKTINALKTHNGGRPADKSFDTVCETDYVFSSLYSFNQDDPNSIIKNLDLYIERGLFPIGIEAGGNAVCLELESNRLVLVNHENEKREPIILESNAELFSELA